MLFLKTFLNFWCLPCHCIIDQNHIAVKVMLVICSMKHMQEINCEICQQLFFYYTDYDVLATAYNILTEVIRRSLESVKRKKSMQTIWPLDTGIGKNGHLLEISYGWKNMWPPAPRGHISPLYLTGLGFQGIVSRRF